MEMMTSVSMGARPAGNHLASWYRNAADRTFLKRLLCDPRLLRLDQRGR